MQNTDPRQVPDDNCVETDGLPVLGDGQAPQDGVDHVIQVGGSRSILFRAAKEVWSSASYDDQLRLAVFQACINHGLVRVGTMFTAETQELNTPQECAHCNSVGLAG